MKTAQKNILHSYYCTIFLTLFLLFSGVHQVMASPEIDVDLSTTEIPLNDFAILTVRLINTDKGELIMPKLDGINIHKRGQSRQVSIINGKMSSSTSYTYMLSGEKKGKYTLPPIILKSQGKIIKSKSIKFSILAESSTNNLQKSGQNSTIQKSPSDLAIIQVSSPKKMYIGETVPIEIKLFFAADTRIEPGSIHLPEISGKGVIMTPLSTTPKENREEYKGKIWNTLSWQTTLSAIKEGENSVSITADAVALLRQAQRKRSQRHTPFDSFFGGNPFDDPFFDNAFTNYARKPLHLLWKNNINVLPLPANGKPENFSGAVGDFDISVSTRVKEIEVGDPLLLQISVSGAGNFDKLNIPELPPENRWRTYPPKVHFEPIGNSGGGQKIFEQAVVIKDSSITAIPPLSLCYFNPELKKYITKKSTPIPLKITGKTSNYNEQSILPETKTTTLTKKEDNLQILNIDIGSLSKDLRPLPQRQWFQVAVLLLLLFCIVTYFVRHLQKRKERNKEQELRKKSIRRLQEDLVTLHAAKENNDSTLFLHACRVAIQNSLARRCGIHPSVVSLGDIVKVLPGSSPVIEIFSMTDTASYGNKSIPATELDKIYYQLKNELESLL